MAVDKTGRFFGFGLEVKGAVVPWGGVSTAYVPKFSAVPPAEGGKDFTAETFCGVSG